MFDPHRYAITIRQAEFDGQVLYEAKVRELPDIAEYAETHEEAYDLAVDAITTTAEALAAQGREMPVPYQPEEDYSGRITLRLPKSLHRRLAEKATEEAVSLNQYMLSVLAQNSGVQSPTNAPQK
ncbi:toxin-antitoxin system HicB family antitoxin [Methylococcus sp. EFPC2]|uniref:toxin-antitoxin system HicB family antitoxin n=1 Tax=Methylococcus sp. EFPC2 TaxID=2812648 RepID=UPI0019685500|nr:toxin-antitoxin system HicB family antitoxin [Methylococcus sp. EFPC2]QSA97581.1 toxin-antitoxin system HicB family antitoxin [Methylococcus sp. EFPC2]